MKLKDKDGLYEAWVPVALMIAGLVYALLCVFVFFPAVDKAYK